MSPIKTPFGFPFPVQTMRGDLAVERQRRLQQEGGVTPILLGDFDAMALHAEALEDLQTELALHVRSAAEVDVGAWFSEQAANSELSEFSHGKWPPLGRARSCLSVPFERDGTPLPDIGLAILPTDRHWESAGWLQFGGWNNCPQPPVHMALWRSWEARYGAQVACITGSVVEFVVERPPATAEAALALAREHFLYCDDLVIQGYGTLEGLAAALLDAPVWSFWWD